MMSGKRMYQKDRAFAAVLAALCMTVSLAFPSIAFYRQPVSKKGVLTSDVNMLDDVTALGCAQVILNFHLSFLNDAQQMRAFDALLEKMNQRGLTITMIVLNDFQNSPLLPTAVPVSDVNFYALNAANAEGAASVQAAAASLAVRYRNLVSNWVIGNEINNAQNYNYAGTADLQSYAGTYAAGFRIFYNAIKAANPDAHVFIPFDFFWNHQNGAQWYGVKQLLPLLNAALRDTDYGIAWHPYPEDFVNGDFMNRSPHATESTGTLIINMKNLHILTDYMMGADMLTAAGKPRHLILSEEGFSSAPGENVQAADIAAAWNIAKANPLVEGFLLNRLVDDTGLTAAGNRFGLWNCDTSVGGEHPTTRKLAWSTYQACS